MIKRRKFRLTRLILIIIIFLSAAFYLRKPDTFRNGKNFLRSLVKGSSLTVGYNAKSLIVVDMGNEEVLASKNENDKHLPASLAKLFVIDYAMTKCNLEDNVSVKTDVLNKVKPGSSVANLQKRSYSVKNILAAMLVPSGNDAAYVLADYVGGKLKPEVTSSDERIELFLKELNVYLDKEGFSDTEIHDPSGFDMSATTTVLDIKKCVEKLLKYKWFRKIVSQGNYTAVLPDGRCQSWENTNLFLNKNSTYYNKNVMGIKTGSLEKDYNLVVLYKKDNKEFLICSLGSESDISRYDDVTYVLKSIDNSGNK